MKLETKNDLSIAVFIGNFEIKEKEKCLIKDKSGKFHDLTDYDLIKLLKEIGEAFEKADKEHKCIDGTNQLTS